MEKTITGDDGIHRTPNEWIEFIRNKIAEADGASGRLLLKRLFKIYAGRVSAPEAPESFITRFTHPSDGIEDAAEKAGEIAKQYVIEILSNNPSHLETEMINLGKALCRKGLSSNKLNNMGAYLLAYIEEQGDLPRSRSDFMAFVDRPTNLRGWFQTSKDMGDALAYYQLRGVCRDNQKG